MIVGASRSRYAHVRYCRHIKGGWAHQCDLPKQPALLEQGPRREPPAGLDRSAVVADLEGAGGAHRAGLRMLNGTVQLLSTLKLEPDAGLDRLLERKLKRPNKVAVFGMPGSGKSYLVGHIVDALMPHDLVDLSLPEGEPLVIQEAHVRATSDVDMDAASDILEYSADLEMPHLMQVDDDDSEHPFFNPFEGSLIFPHGAGGSRSAVPINGIPTICRGEPRFVIRVLLIRPVDAIEAVRKGVERMLDEQEDGEGADEPPALLEDEDEDLEEVLSKETEDET